MNAGSCLVLVTDVYPLHCPTAVTVSWSPVRTAASKQTSLLLTVMAFALNGALIAGGTFNNVGGNMTQVLSSRVRLVDLQADAGLRRPGALTSSLALSGVQ
jgi:hypothetical protein